MLSTWLDNIQTWAESGSLSHFQRAIPLEWISQVLQSTDKASIIKRKFPAELVVWLIIGTGLYRDTGKHAGKAAKNARGCEAVRSTREIYATSQDNNAPRDKPNAPATPPFTISHSPFRQSLNQPALRNILFHRPAGNQRCAQPRQRGIAGHLNAVSAQSRHNRNSETLPTGLMPQRYFMLIERTDRHPRQCRCRQQTVPRGGLACCGYSGGDQRRYRAGNSYGGYGERHRLPTKLKKKPAPG